MKALHDADGVVGRVDAWLSAQQNLGRRTLLIVTTDRGRAADFRSHGKTREAARIWTLWSGNRVLARGYPSAMDSRLADLAPTVRQLLGLHGDLDARAGRDQQALIGQAPNTLEAADVGSVAQTPLRF